MSKEKYFKLRIRPSIFLFGLILLSVGCFPISTYSSGKVKAFPGAEGFGAWSKGGRGGIVLFVTNLNDKGPGSLRAACRKKGPRIVIFKVSGIIELQSALTITEPYLTIAGQTAPGDGICLKNYACIVEKTHDIVIRYLRVRPGDPMKVEQDAISVMESKDVIIDHCSAGWGTDETISVTGAGCTNVTVQWCMITESLNNSVHHKGEHGYGSLIRIDGNVSFHHNLYAHHNSRNPRPGCYGDMERGGTLDFRNNVIYDWGIHSGYSAEDKITMNLIGNYLKPGPSTQNKVRKVLFHIGGNSTNLFAANNMIEGFPAGDTNNWLMITAENKAWLSSSRLSSPIPEEAVSTDSPLEAYEKVLTSAGALLPKRDTVDQRMVAEVTQGRGKIIDTQEQVGGWTEYRSTLPPKDSDSDGLPDVWEIKNHCDPQNGSDAPIDSDNDGYTNIEEYINGTNPLRADGEIR